MFTIKLYRDGKTRIYEAGSITVLGDARHYEMTLHDVPRMNDFRVDITFEEPAPECPVTYWLSAIVENSNGKTSHMLNAEPFLKAA